MKILKSKKGRKRYTVIINDSIQVAFLTVKNSLFDSRISPHGFARVFDCNFNEAVNNIKILSRKGYFISKRTK